jgi:presequence protease
LSKIGTERLNNMELSQEIELYTGGIICEYHIIPNLSNFEVKEIGFSINSYSLNKNVDKMTELIFEILSTPRLNDIKYLKTLLDQQNEAMVNSIVEFANLYSGLISSSFVSSYGVNYFPFKNQLTFEKLRGLTFLKFLNELSTNHKIEEIAKNLKELNDFVLIRNNWRVILTTGDSMSMITNKIVEMTKKLPSREINIENETKFVPSSPKTYVKFNIQMNSCSQSMLTVPFHHQDYPYMLILSSIILWKHLHTEIREKGFFKKC